MDCVLLGGPKEHSEEFYSRTIFSLIIDSLGILINWIYA